ncbi:MAG: DMT family transporter [Bacilli bacterium]|nr:DMT family transporter [Bacilli bacterium]
MNKKVLSIFLVVLAAALYAINIPLSKLLLNCIEPTMMASYLYLGAGIGIGLVFLITKKKQKEENEKFTKKDFPYVLGMIVLDIVAPILLMFGLLDSASSNASLLNNFEIVCTSLIALLLGFVAYGLSIFFYIKAQGIIGASKTSAYYSVAPFIGTFLSFIIFQEKLTWSYFVGLAIMIIGTIIVVIDTLAKKHNHVHKHIITHTHDGSTHSHVVEHEHEHNHYLTDEKHIHHHSKFVIE